jgi:Ser/Thr protein kinase RdoA (MazF antagonist)
MRTIYSTVLAEDIGLVVQENYPLGKIVLCYLLRRGFNDVYALENLDGRKFVARLSSHRARGLPNVVYETELLTHLANHGVKVATSVFTKHGTRHILAQVGETERALVVFEHLDGEPPGDVLADIEVMGQGLAQIHNAAANFNTANSLYRIDLLHLLKRPLERILAIPTLDPKLRQDFIEIGVFLDDQSQAHSNLAKVTCHGDCHGGNAFVSNGANGERIASFFDFDDAGPGTLAYDLAVFLWQLIVSKPALDEGGLNKWASFVSGYRRVAELPSNDFKAIAYFVALRHIWFIGEYAGRIHEWGTQVIPNPWLRKQIPLIRSWASIETPAA